MSAHDPIGNGPAHESTPPRGSSKMKHINIDETGMSMGMKTAVSIFSGIIGLVGTLVGVIVFLVVSWYTFLGSNASKEDLSIHNVYDQVHKVQLEKGAPLIALPLAVKQNHITLKKVATIEQDVISVKNGFTEYRVEDLADKAAANVKDPNRKVRRWKTVRDKAKANLKASKPIREGLEEYL